MLLLVVWIAVLVLVVVVLGSVVYGVVGAMQRLGREVAALDRDLRPVLAQIQETTARAAATRSGADQRSSTDPSGSPA